MKNAFHFKRIYRLFRLSTLELDYIKKIEYGYYAISTVISQKDAKIIPHVEILNEKISEFFKQIAQKEPFIKSLEQQVDVFNCEG